MAIKASVYLEFIENHLPTLKAGRYRFSGQQILEGDGIGDNNRFKVELAPFQVKVAGERFTINPTEIAAIFPPNNSLGHYAHVLPHMALKRDTLPWERMLAMSSDEATEARLEKAPWLALLVLNEDELLTSAGAPPQSVEEHQGAAAGYVKTVPMLNSESIKGAHWPPHLDPDENPEERFKVIYVKKSVLQRLLPNEKGLTWLAHARKSRIGLQGVKARQHVELFNDKGELLHQEAATGDNGSIDCGRLEAGAYTIKVDGSPIDDQPLQLNPSDQVGGEMSIVVANRLPAEGVKSIIHLVSLEGRYKQNGADFVFDFDGYGEAIPLVSLHNWSFTALTEKETFRHILLHLNHEFLFSLDAQQLPAEPSIDHLRNSFLTGGNPLSSQALVADVAVKEARDKDHCYYVGKRGALYNAAGRRVAAGNGIIPANKDQFATWFPGLRLHSKTATYANVTARQLWVGDGDKLYFVSEDPVSRRLLVSLLPGDATPSLRLPSREGKDADSARANHFLQQGYAPLPHHFRRGGKSVSWYRSPLLPGKPDKQIADDQLPVQTADELLRYDMTYGMFDTAYAAAWELGRLLCLRDKRVSLALYRWKRTHVRLLKTMEQQYLHPHLPFRANAAGQLSLPENVEAWLSELSLLKGVPSSYLVPDERMLPPESLRFFYLDPSWVACLMDGALSIGRVNKGHDTAVHKQILTDSAAVDKGDVISGFLLRSSAVKGWPNLQVNAYNYSFSSDGEAAEDARNENIPSDSNSELPPLRLERLADNLLFGLFQGEMTVLDIHENPETVHFGFHVHNALRKVERYGKYPLKADGQESDKLLIPTEQADYLDEDRRVIRPTILAAALQRMDLGYQSFTPAQYALSLIEGVARVRFIKSAPRSIQ